MFASFLRPGADEELYEEVRDVDRLIKLLGDYMEEFNETNHSQVCVSAVLSFLFGVAICLPRRGRLIPASTRFKLPPLRC